MVLIHLLLNALALFILNNFLNKFYRSKTLSFIACILLLFCFPYQEYNTYLYTESAFFSLTILYSCFVLSRKRFDLLTLGKMAAFLAMLCITRPTGIFFAGATFVYLLFAAQRLSMFQRIFIFTTTGIAGLFILNFLMGIGGPIDILRPFKEGNVICEVPQSYLEFGPTNVVNGNSLGGLLIYISENPAMFFKLVWLKTKAFFGLYREHYSNGHNIFIMGFFFPLYILLATSLIIKWKMLPKEIVWYLAIIMVYWLSVAFSCDEWHNRFFLTLTPFIIIPSLLIFAKLSSTKYSFPSSHY